jgi:hypothetical protein
MIHSATRAGSSTKDAMHFSTASAVKIAIGNDDLTEMTSPHSLASACSINRKISVLRVRGLWQFRRGQIIAAILSLSLPPAELRRNYPELRFSRVAPLTRYAAAVECVVLPSGPECGQEIPPCR